MALVLHYTEWALRCISFFDSVSFKQPMFKLYGGAKAFDRFGYRDDVACRGLRNSLIPEKFIIVANNNAHFAVAA